MIFRCWSQYLIIFSLVFFVKLTAGAQENPFDSLQLTDSAFVYFDFGKSNLRAEALPILDSLVNLTLPYGKKYLVNIVAHTDSIGSLRANELLSARRAKSVRNYLLTKNLPESRIRMDHYGESKPATSNRDEAGRQLNRRARIELFRIVPMIELTGRILRDSTEEGVSARIIAHHRSFRDSTRSDSSGFFRIPVRPGKVIGLDVFASGYFFESEYVRSSKPGEPIPTLTFQLQSLRDSMVIPLKNFYFVGNRAILLDKSKPELPKLLRFMQFNNKIQIEIAGHVNHPNSPPLDTTTWEFKLSQRRAKMVYEYLTENGIEPDRMEHNGYGNWEMVYPNAVAERDQAKNRRVEIRIRSTGTRISAEER